MAGLGAEVLGNSNEFYLGLFCCFQVTLNNVEVCSENIMTLKKTLEVWSGFFTGFSLIKFVISSLGGGCPVNHPDFAMPKFLRSLPSSLRKATLSWESNPQLLQREIPVPPA